MEKEEIKEQETQETTEEEIEQEEIDVTKLSDDELKAKSKELKEGAGKKEVKKEEKKIEEKEKIKSETTSAEKVVLSPEEKLKKQQKDREEFAGKQREEIETLKKQIKNQEDLIQQRAREIGDLRKSVKDLQAKTGEVKTETSEETEKDPILSFEKRKVAIKQAIPNIEEIKQDIADIVRKEGYETEENINLFLNNPYMADPGLLQEWANKVMRNKYSTEIEALKKDKETLTKENESLKKQLQTTGKTVIKNIEKAAQTTKTLTAKTGTEEEEGSLEITEDQIPYLSDEQLMELRKKIAKKR